VLHAVRLGYEWQQEQQRAAAAGQTSAAEQAVMPILINAARGDAARARRAFEHARKVGAANPALYALGRLDAMRGADRRADADPSYLQGYDDFMRELEPGSGTPAAAEAESAPAPKARRRRSKHEEQIGDWI